jgi:hypothetical protein
MSALRMLRPADGREGVKRFVVETVAKAGPNPCPPIVVGVGIGGTFELSALLAKKSLLRRLGEPNPDPDVASLEAELLEAVNRLGIGPAGLGGTVTALAVHVETHPCHIASLPVAVNINCHSTATRCAVTPGHDLPIGWRRRCRRRDVGRRGRRPRPSLGTDHTARDAAHALIALLREGKPLPFPTEGQGLLRQADPPRRPAHRLRRADHQRAHGPLRRPLLAAGLRG